MNDAVNSTMNDAIRRFSGPFSFLSNFQPVPIEYEGLTYPSVEHAFQAAKTGDPAARQRVQAAKSAGDAKRLGRTVTLHNWTEERRLDIMEQLLRKKFSIASRESERLYHLLLGTGGYWLEEGNTWGDRFWGTVNGEGTNYLGSLLMIVREDLRQVIQRQIQTPIQVKKVEQWELNKTRQLDARLKREPFFTPEIHRQLRNLPVYIGRPSMWGNPYTHHQDGTAAKYVVRDRTEAIANYETYLLGDSTLLAMLPTLRNRTLACWCKPLDCHGDVLARMAEGRLSWSLERRVGMYAGVKLN